MSSSPPTKRPITSSSSPARSCPCATAMRARDGASARTRSAIVAMVSTRLCTKYTCPARSSSRASASSISASSHGSMNVSTGERSFGGVSSSVRSRSPASDRCRVRGIGVAVSVSTSTACFSALSRSLCRTPNRCSSSTMSSPRSRNCTSFESSRCVPMTMSSSPRSRRSAASFASFGFRKRDSTSMRAG